MGKQIEFEIMGLPKILTNVRMHWAVRHKENVKWKELTVDAVRLQQKRGARPFKKASVTLTRYSSVEPDFDGLTSSFKSVLDGLVEAGVIIDDKVSVIGQPKYEWQKAKPKEGKIKVKVEAVPLEAA